MRAPPEQKQTTDRDVLNRAVKQFDQLRATPIRVIDQNTRVAASEEWVQITASDGTASHRFLLEFEDQSRQFVDSEPFFISGSRSFTVLQENGGGYYDTPYPLFVTKAARREFLSASATPEAAANTRFHSWLVLGGESLPPCTSSEYVSRGGTAVGTPVFVGTQWTAAGFPGSLPYGWGAESNRRRGRYFSAEVSASVPSGNVGIDLLCLTPGFGPGYTRRELVPATAPLAFLILSIGDDVPGVVLSTPFAGAVFAEATLKTCVSWALAYRHTAAGSESITAVEYIIRRGF